MTRGSDLLFFPCRIDDRLDNPSWECWMCSTFALGLDWLSAPNERSGELRDMRYLRCYQSPHVCVPSHKPMIQAREIPKYSVVYICSSQSSAASAARIRYSCRSSLHRRTLRDPRCQEDHSSLGQRGRSDFP